MVAANLLAGSVPGAWLGATWATRLRSRTLHRVIAGRRRHRGGAPPRPRRSRGSWHRRGRRPCSRHRLGLAMDRCLVARRGRWRASHTHAGASLGTDIRLAGSLSLVVSLPTMLTGFSRYSRDRSFGVVRESYRFLGAMAAGSVVGGVVGGRLVGWVPSTVLLPALAAAAPQCAEALDSGTLIDQGPVPLACPGPLESVCPPRRASAAALHAPTMAPSPSVGPPPAPPPYPNPSAPRTTTGSFRTTRFRKSKSRGSGHARSGCRALAELYAVA